MTDETITEEASDRDKRYETLVNVVAERYTSRQMATMIVVELLMHPVLPAVWNDIHRRNISND